LFLGFINIFFNSIIKEGFAIQNRGSAADSFETTGFILAERQVGGALCILVTVNSDGMSSSDLRNIIERVTKISSVYDNYFSTIYLVFVFVGENPSNDVFEIINSGEVFERQKIYNIYWGVSLSDFTVHTNKLQPSEMYGIRLCIDNSLKALKRDDNMMYSKNYDQNIQFDELHANAEMESNLKVKSVNSFASYGLIILNLAITSLMLLLDATQHFWFEGAIIPGAIWGHNEYYRLFTSMFIHANIAHVISNCLGIYIFGTRIEKYFGKLNFFIIYLGSGFLAGIFSLIFTRGMSAGASGAVYGLIGAVAVKAFISRKELDGISAYLVVIWIVVGFIMSSMMPGVDAFGHLGGLLSGALLGYILGRGEK